MTSSPANHTLGALPDPGQARTLDELTQRLRSLKIWAGDPSYETIKERVNEAWRAAGRPDSELTKKATVVDCFKTGRRRINADLVIALVQALHPDQGYVTQWRHALRVVSAETQAASQVRTQDRLPDDLPEFTGRTAELKRLRRLLRAGGDAATVCAVEGMAGVGKTQLVIHTAHLLARDRPFDQILFVDLRGFHADPAQPPADPAAVLDSFLHLLGVPGHQIPHDTPARAEVYRGRLAGRRALVVLDNAADEEQLRPLLPDGPGCLTLISSRRRLAGLRGVTHVAVDVLKADEARTFLARAAPRAPAGDDRNALARIAGNCGYLPLALGLISGHMRTRPDWTLNDHADRLEQRHRDRRLETGVQLALSLSYQHLIADRRRLFRLLALHPGQDLDTYAAAALGDTDPDTAGRQLRRLRDEHLLQQHTPGRFVFHDLVRAYAVDLATDEDRPTDRRAALTRLFDFYLSTAASAMDTLHPAEARRRPTISAATTARPDLTDPDVARSWLDAELTTLTAIAAHTAGHGWPGHAIRLSAVLFRYLDGGHYTEALIIHRQAEAAAEQIGDPGAQAQAVLGFGATQSRLGRYGPAGDHLERASALFRQAGDRLGEARAQANLGNVDSRLGRYRQAADHYGQAMTLFRQAGDPTGEARALGNLGMVEERLGHYRPAADHLEQALALSRLHGDRTGEAQALDNLGIVHQRLSQPARAADRHEEALELFRQLGNQSGEAWALDSLGTVHTRLGRHEQAADFHERALALFRRAGDRDGEAWACNGLGEAAQAAGDPSGAITHHLAALTAAVETGARDQQARAHTGLGHADGTLTGGMDARRHYESALALYTELGSPEAESVRAYLT